MNGIRARACACHACAVAPHAQHVLRLWLRQTRGHSQVHAPTALFDVFAQTRGNIIAIDRGRIDAVDLFFLMQALEVQLGQPNLGLSGRLALLRLVLVKRVPQIHILDGLQARIVRVGIITTTRRRAPLPCARLAAAFPLLLEKRIRHAGEKTSQRVLVKKRR